MVYEIVLLFESNKQSPQLVESCIPALQIRTEFLLDMLRSMMFSVIIGYFSTTRERSKPQVPSYNMHYLTDFSVDVECQAVFKKFLRRTDEQCFRDYAGSLGKLETDDSIISDVFSKQVHQSFRQFCKTVAFQTLYSIRIDNDRVAELGLEVNK